MLSLFNIWRQKARNTRSSYPKPLSKNSESPIIFPKWLICLKIIDLDVNACANQNWIKMSNKWHLTLSLVACILYFVILSVILSYFSIFATPSQNVEFHINWILTHYSPVLLFYTHWKHQETFRFSDIFMGYRKATLGCNGLMKIRYLRGCYVVTFCPLLLPSKGCRMHALSSDLKLTKQILRVGCPSYNINS